MARPLPQRRFRRDVVSVAVTFVAIRACGSQRVLGEMASLVLGAHMVDNVYYVKS